MDSQQTYYDILEVSQNATQAAIRKSYYKKSLKYHPDKNPDNAEEAKERFILIGEAYNILSDEEKRLNYDRELASGNAAFRLSSSNRDDSETYESYRQAFDERMASLSPEEYSMFMTAASVIGSIVGTVYGAKLGSKIAGKSFGKTAGSMLGSLAGSHAARSMAQNTHESSVDRIMYEEKKNVAMQRGEPIPERPKRNKPGWKDLKESFNKTVDEFKKQQQQQSGQR